MPTTINPSPRVRWFWLGHLVLFTFSLGLAVFAE